MNCLVELAAYRARYLYPKGVEPVDAYCCFGSFIDSWARP